MSKIMVILGVVLFSGIGWWIGEHIGIMTAYLLSVVGMGIGLFVGRWVVKNYLF